MSCQFTYKGITYECTGKDKDFQLMNFKHAISEQDWVTVKNRIHNQITCWKCLKVVKEEGTFTSTVKPSRTESEDSDIIIDQNGTRKNKHNFW